jgi:hypothetical protein
MSRAVFRGWIDYDRGFHPKGIENIRAAVVERAYRDYVIAAKKVVSYRGDYIGKNTKRTAGRKGRSANTNWNREQDYMDAVFTVETIYGWFTSPRFMLFSDLATGEEIIHAANRFVWEWSRDKWPFSAVFPSADQDVIKGTMRGAKSKYA